MGEGPLGLRAPRRGRVRGRPHRRGHGRRCRSRRTDRRRRSMRAPRLRGQPHPPRVRRRSRRRVRGAHGGPAVRGGWHPSVRGRDARGERRRTAAASRPLRRDEARRAGITTIEIKSGYGLDARARGPLPRGRSAVHRRHDVPRRPRGAAGVRRQVRRLRAPRVHRHAGRGAATQQVDRLRSARSARSTWTSRGRCSSAGRGRGPRAAPPRQPARPRPGRAARGRDGLCLGRSLHLPVATTTSPRSPPAAPWPRSCRPPTSAPASRIPTRVEPSTPA